MHNWQLPHVLSLPACLFMALCPSLSLQAREREDVMSAKGRELQELHRQVLRVCACVPVCAQTCRQRCSAAPLHAATERPRGGTFDFRTASCCPPRCKLCRKRCAASVALVCTCRSLPPARLSGLLAIQMQVRSCASTFLPHIFSFPCGW